MTVFAYYRVSTDHQDYESQKIGVVEYAKRAGLTIDKEIIDDGVSGTIVAKKRKLGKILKTMQAGDTIITSELSRLGRSITDVINTCNLIACKKVNCCLVKQGITIDQSPMGKMMIAILGAFSEMERDLLIMRTKEGLARAKANGVVLGRKKGQKNDKHVYDGKEIQMIAMCVLGASTYQIGKAAGVSVATVSRRLKSLGLSTRHQKEKDKQ